ncbi:MAG: hypothetical protein KJZ72_02170 [Anaerolineales bacterium]|nr:hypothetical protein [Anaerolineales bacterium]
MKKINLLIIFILSACSLSPIQETVIPDQTLPETPIIHPSVAPTVIVTPTWVGNYDALIATTSAMQTQASYFPRICDNYSPSRYSPDGLWLEEMCYSKEDQDLILTISNKETGILWEMLYHDYLPELDFFPDGYMAVVHWSNDGNYAYFFSSLGGDGHYCYVKGWDSGVGLFQLNLKNGAVNTILPPNTTYWWYDFSFSPTDKRLVYGVQGKDFYILDMTNRNPIRVNKAKDFDEGGGVVWSSDGLQYVYSTIISDYENSIYATSVRLVDSLTGQEQILLEASNDCYSVEKWDNDLLYIESEAERVVFEYDLETKRIINKSQPNP